MTTELRLPLIRRFRPAQWLILDCLCALAVAALTWGTLAQDGASRSAAGVASILVGSPIVLARRHPAGAFVAALAPFWLTPFEAALVWPALGPMVWTLYFAASRCATANASIILLASLSGPLATVLPRFAYSGAVLPFELCLITAWTVGWTVKQTRSHDRALLGQHRAEAEAAVTASHQSILQERMRLARELHDLVAHGLSIVTVQAGFGVLVLDRDPEQARAALAAIQSTGHETLVEMRRLVGVLRADEGGGDGSRPELAPVPGLGDLARLIEQTTSARVQVGLLVTGQARPLAPGLELSAYRIVQEALTNVVKHAGPATVQVTIGHGENELSIEVTDDGLGSPPQAPASQSPGGQGLPGMRERVALFNGWMDAEPLPGRGFRVSARLPLSPPCRPMVDATAGLTADRT
jgi:signal transduction histidine kinase